MKIGIMTFHWAANHGAIIQAFALQQCLQKCHSECEVQIIDYYPKRYHKGVGSIFRSLRPVAIRKNYKEYKKEHLLQKFRVQLKKTKYYASVKELEQYASDFDIVICGSDQVWNEYFTMHGEGGITTAYFLSFCPNSKKIAYAASFGFAEMKEEMQKIVKPLLENFSAISVRENSGKMILDELGIPCEKVCDPTFLVDKTLYRNLAIWDGDRDIIAKYILRRQTTDTEAIINEITTRYAGKTIVDLETLNMEHWLGAIANAKCTITNSFHCTVFSILFHTPFYVVNEVKARSGMNDRLATLLSELDLSERIVDSVDKMDKLIVKDIDWNRVDEKLKNLVQGSLRFLLKHCFGENME